jgi:protein involved in polysaccharide export with SLBB domain
MNTKASQPNRTSRRRIQRGQINCAVFGMRPAPLFVISALLAACSLIAAESPELPVHLPVSSEQTKSESSTERAPAAEKPVAARPGQAPDSLSTLGRTNAMESLDPYHLLTIGDRLSFRIIEDEEDPKPLFVTDSGDLEVPYIGRFPAVGKTCHELARSLKAELEKEYYYQATVIVAVDVMAKSRGKVYLVGPVRAPGPQEIPSDEVLTLSKAILRAGGFSDFADKHKVKVTRRLAGANTEKTFIIDVAEVLEKGRTESDLPLEPGDLIYVPERLFRF